MGPEGKHLAVCYSFQVKFTHVMNLMERWKFTIMRGLRRITARSNADGYSSGIDGQVKVWSVANWQCISAIHAQGPIVNVVTIKKPVRELSIRREYLSALRVLLQKYAGIQSSASNPTPHPYYVYRVLRLHHIRLFFSIIPDSLSPAHLQVL